MIHESDIFVDDGDVGKIEGILNGLDVSSLRIVWNRLLDPARRSCGEVEVVESRCQTPVQRRGPMRSRVPGIMELEHHLSWGK